MLIHLVLGFSLFETLALAGVLLAWADRVDGARPLAVFLLGIALWISGNELPNWFGPRAEPAMMALLATAPLTSAFFFHFCIVFCRVDPGRRAVALAYGLGGMATLFAQVLDPAHLERNAWIGWIAFPDAVGVINSAAWVVLGLSGLVVLFRALLRARAPAFNQIAAVAGSCAWGCVCLTGYAIAVAGLPLYPFPLLGLPLYPVILVYGILRYGVVVANAWARRALVWTLLLALGAVVVALTPLLPFESRWLGGLAVAASCLALNGPIRRVAERLVYPGGDVSVQDLGRWRQALQAAETLPALATLAAALIGRRVGIQVDVLVGTLPAPARAVARLVCTRGAQGWATTLQGWDAAPPGPRQAAELFGSVLADVAALVEQAQQIAARERERQLQARLAELGALAATVAHDIRNPLNIISMAVATAPAPTRREVAQQVARISHLASDLLDYAKPWKLAATRVDLAEHVRRAVARLPQVSLGDGLNVTLTVEADPRRIDQALANLLENARFAAAAQAGGSDGDDNGNRNANGDIDADGRSDVDIVQPADAAPGDAPRHPAHVHVDGETTPEAVLLHVCDDGPGVPAEIRARLFEPFASRSPGGTGLGLAIVARVMQAHGGSVALTERTPWRTCFTLSFPKPP